MRFRDLHPNIKIRFVEMFVANILGNMIYPFMTIYFAQRMGAALTGILLMVNVLVGVVAEFYGGTLADKIGRRKVILFSEFLRFGAFGVTAFANSPWFDSTWVTFAMAMLLSIFWGLSSPAQEAMLIDCSTEANRPLIYGFGYWAWNVSVLVGSLIGGFFFQTHRFEIFLGATCASLLSIALIYFFIQETYVPEKREQLEKNPLLSIISAYKSVVTDKLFMLFLLAGLLNGAIENMAGQYTSVRLIQEFQPQQLFSFGGFSLQADGVRMYGLLTATNTFIVVLLGLVAVHVIKKISQRFALVAGILLYAAGYAIVSFSNQPWLLILFTAVATIGELIWVPVMQSTTPKLIPDDKRSTYMAVFGTSFKLKMVMASLSVTLGSFVSSYVMSGLFFLSGVIAIVLFSGLFTKLEKKEQKQAGGGIAM
ncbi:MFS transporter [Brevibacillus fluminis]|uniref:MFS transporter n=1 Tax=Brevibacillus fluminis TaxID=511487 RepID=A0A3M8CUX7_9BACL|nr:MFS transporter [Brevibacillus fluminis]RNB79493.1 MFS transporter [Brevibacillus fluminis]